MSWTNPNFLYVIPPVLEPFLPSSKHNACRSAWETVVVVADEKAPGNSSKNLSLRPRKNSPSEFHLWVDAWLHSQTWNSRISLKVDQACRSWQWHWRSERKVLFWYPSGVGTWSILSIWLKKKSSFLSLCLHFHYNHVCKIIYLK